jgi:hypothetical protein
VPRACAARRVRCCAVNSSARCSHYSLVLAHARDDQVELFVPPPGGDAVRFTAATKVRERIRRDLARELGIEVNDGLPTPPPLADAGGDPVDIPPARWDDVRGLIDTIRDDWSVELSVPPPGDAVRFTAPKRKRDNIREDLTKALGIQVNDGMPIAGGRITRPPQVVHAPAQPPTSTDKPHRVEPTKPTQSRPPPPPYASGAGAAPPTTITSAVRNSAVAAVNDDDDEVSII